MSIIKCHECGHQVSTEADNCSGCGAKVKKPIGRLGWLFALLLGFSAFQCSTSKPSIPPPPKTATQIAEEAAQREVDQQRQTVAIAAFRAIKSSMRDPESLIIESLRVGDDSKVVCIEYRAKNGFGGINREFVTYINGKPKKAGELWNKHCTKPLVDLMYAIK